MLGHQKGDVMNFTPREKDKLMISLAAIVARTRLERGVKLNYPESVALITDFVMEGARDGKSVAELTSESRKVLSYDLVVAQHLAAFGPELSDRLAIACSLHDEVRYKRDAFRIIEPDAPRQPSPSN